MRRNLITSLREHIPLQQGLRRVGEEHKNEHNNNLREHIPLQQGLRRNQMIPLHAS